MNGPFGLSPYSKMKNGVATLLSLVLSCFLPARSQDEVLEIWANPGPTLDRISRQIHTADLGAQDENSLANDLQGLAYAINQEIISAASPDWANPSLQRKAVIEKWGDILEPYTPDLVDLALDDSSRQTVAGRQGRSLLDFAAPTKAFAEQVRRYLRKGGQEGEAGADLLYEHRLLEDGDREFLVQQMSRKESRDERLRYACFLKGLDIAEFDGFLLEEAKILLNTRPRDYSPEEVTDHYGIALAIASTLGPDAVVLLPEIESIMADPLIQNSGLVPRFEDARSHINGVKSRQVRLARNGSGPLGSWFLEGNLRESDADSSPSGSLEQAGEATDPDLIVSVQVGESASTTWWLVGLALFVATPCLYLVLRKKRVGHSPNEDGQ